MTYIAVLLCLAAAAPTAPIPPFGCSLDPGDGPGFPRFGGYIAAYLAQWPEPAKTPESKTPLDDKWYGPYKNASGRKWIAQINEWYLEGKASGLTQDTFRSFDNGHSGIRAYCCPQMRIESPVDAFGARFENIFPSRVTMGVQSYGINGKSVIETYSSELLRTFYESKPAKPIFQRVYRTFYENNFLFIAPAVGSFGKTGDAFTFLSPFYLHSVGASGTDAKLMRPFVLASAALPRDLKTRMLRTGLFVPTLMYLFKSNLTGDIKSPEAHVAAYSLPEEAAEDSEGPTPILDRLLNAAHCLDHIPPVCRLRVETASVETDGNHNYGSDAYHEENTYAFTGALREGQTFDLKVDLHYSWTDGNRPITAYYASVLRGKATIESLNPEGSLLKVRIPWTPMGKLRDYRTDVLVLVNDGAYYSAPAYISVRIIHKLDPLILGIKVQ